MRTSLVFHTSLKDVDLLREINRDFGLEPPPATDGGQLGDHLRQLNDFLMNQYAQGKQCAIIIDDAQNLDRASMELVRMISNLEVDRQKLVQILLVGQTELMMTLGSPALRQMQSRIVIRKVVRSLSREELQDYIRFKLDAAGNGGAIHMTRPALWRLYRITRGNCRYVNLLLDRCLYALCHLSEKVITRHIIGLAHTDLKPEKARRNMRALSLSTALLAAAVIVSWTLHLYTGRTTLAAVSQETRYPITYQSVAAPVATA